MNGEIKELSKRLHVLYEQLMEANPWDDGYGEVAVIHEYLLKVLRDHAQKDFSEFQKCLEQTSKDIEEMWSSNSSQLAQWRQKLRPVFEQVEAILSNAVPLLALL